MDDSGVPSEEVGFVSVADHIFHDTLFHHAWSHPFLWAYFSTIRLITPYVAFVKFVGIDSLITNAPSSAGAVAIEAIIH